MSDFKLVNVGRVFLLISCLLPALLVSAEFQDNNGDGQAEAWPSPQFTFYTGSLLGAAGLWIEAFQEAADRWNDAATDFQIIIVAESSSKGRCTLTGNNTAYFSDDICGDEFGTGVLAVATNTYIPSLNRLTKSEIIFNKAEPWSVYDGDLNFLTYDFRRVAIHELGHSMGLGHSARQDSIMQAFANNTFIPQIEEVNFVKAVYGNKSFTLKINIEGKGKVVILPTVLGTGVVNNNIFYTSNYSNFLDCNEGFCVIAIQEGLRLSVTAIAENGESFLSWDGTSFQSRGLSLGAFNSSRTLTARFTASPATDADNDGLGDSIDTDVDNDGVLDVNDAFPLDSSESLDTDGDGVGNNADIDDDNDGVQDFDDTFPLDSSESLDTDGDGVGNNADNDDDNDGVEDDYDAFPLDASAQKLSSGVQVWLLKAAKDLQAEQKSN